MSDELLEDAAHKLAMLGLQSSRYASDPSYKEAVDDVLGLTLSRPADRRQHSIILEIDQVSRTGDTGGNSE